LKTENIYIDHIQNIHTINLISIPVLFNIELFENDMIEFTSFINKFGFISIPDNINKILISKACRGAIMFGVILFFIFDRII
jgi:hypothetical protein